MKPRTERYPLYGAIPLLEHNSKGRNGIVHTWYQYDPAFKPALPKNAVRGDVARQMYCPAHYVQKYFYVDEQETCVQCHEAFVFSAKEQKFWYESLQFNFNSTAIRCRSCGRRRQTERALREQIALALRQLAERPDDPTTLLDLARATVRYRERYSFANYHGVPTISHRPALERFDRGSSVY
jgi:Probable zinc-ribbon domain